MTPDSPPPESAAEPSSNSSTNAGSTSGGSTIASAARAHHRSVYDATIGLELALAAPAIELGEWLRGVEAGLVAVGSAVAAHLAESEEASGLYDEVVARAPRLQHDIERLRAEHHDLEDLVAEALRLVRAAELDPDVVPIVRDRCLDLFVRVSRHRHDSVDLVYQAYDLELGGGD